MTPLRQQAFEMLQSFPDEKLFVLIQFMQAEKRSRLSREQRIKEKRIALDELLQFSKPIPELDDEKELAQYREEKFGNAHIN